MIEANKDLVRRYIEEFVNAGDLERADKFIHRDFEHLTAGFKGPEGYRDHVRILRSAFPDFHIELESLIAEDDVVAFFSTWRGTHLGQHRGVAPSGRTFEFKSTGFRRIRGGKITEAWGAGDVLTMYQQLGIVPTPPESSVINKEIVRRFFNEMVTGARPELGEELIGPGFVRHVWAFGKPVEARGPEAITGAIHRLHSKLDGFHERVQQIVAEGDLVACRVDWGGRHVDELFGVPASGREVNTESYRIMRLKDGKVIEMWSLGDNYGQLMQMGALPPR